MISTDLLREALAVLKDAGVQRAQVKLPDLELSVEFTIELPPPVLGTAPLPGEWKTLRLDEPTELDPQGGR